MTFPPPRMHAYWEEIANEPGFIVGLVRIGKYAREWGDDYQFQILAVHKNNRPVELKGLTATLTREARDALALCLLSRGFVTYCLERFKDHVPVPMRSAPIRISSTFIKEFLMSAKNAHDAAMTHWDKAIHTQGQNDAENALTPLCQAVSAELKDLEDKVFGPMTIEDRLTALLPVARAGDTLAAAGLQLPQDTPKQVAIRHAIHSTGVAVKHFVNDITAPTGIPATAV